MFYEKRYELDKLLLKISIPYEKSKVSNWKINNIDFYDKDGKLLYNVSKLLNDYSSKNEINLYDEVFLDIEVFTSNNILCKGFKFVYEINIETEEIIRITANR